MTGTILKAEMFIEKKENKNFRVSTIGRDVGDAGDVGDVGDVGLNLLDTVVA